MPRIRSIKPEFADSEAIGNVSREARLLLVMLMTHADDAGRLRGNHRYLAHTLYPYDSDAEAKIGNWLAELEGQGEIQTYRYAGNVYVALCHWERDQKIDKPYPSRLPAPPRAGQIDLPFELTQDDNPRADTTSEIASARRRRETPSG